MKALLHCGTFKTGSTTIQNTAWHNQDVLRKYGVIYPKAGIDTRAAKDEGEIGYRHSRFIYEYGKDSYPTLLTQLDKEIREADGRTFFMSAEPWSNPQAAPTLKAMVDHLTRRGFKEVQGIVFVRNARDYMVSHYREWVRRYGVSLPFQAYVLSRKHFFDYLTICKKIASVFRGNVEFLSYSEIPDVSQFTFEKLGLAYDTLARPAQTNRGLPCLDAEIYRLLNQYGLHIKDLPNSQSLLEHFGLSAQDADFVEQLPSGFLDIYGRQYIREFSSLTGIVHADCKTIFENRKTQGIDIGTASPILEKVVFEWLRQNRRQAS